LLYFLAGIFDALDELFGFRAAQPIHVHPLAPETPGCQDAVRKIHVPLCGQVSDLVLALVLTSANDHHAIGAGFDRVQHEVHVDPSRALCPDDLHRWRVF